MNRSRIVNCPIDCRAKILPNNTVPSIVNFLGLLLSIRPYFCPKAYNLFINRKVVTKSSRNPSINVRDETLPAFVDMKKALSSAIRPVSNPDFDLINFVLGIAFLS